MEGPQPIKNTKEKESISPEISEELLSVDDSQEGGTLLSEEESKKINEYKEKLRQDFNFDKLVERYAQIGHQYAVENGVIDCDYETYILIAKERYEILLETISFSVFLYEKYAKSNELDRGWKDVCNLLSYAGANEANREGMMETLFSLGSIRWKADKVKDERVGFYNYKNPQNFPQQFYCVLDHFFEQKPDVVIAIPKSGIPLAIILKQISEEYSKLNSGFDPEFRIPPYKIREASSWVFTKENIDDDLKKKGLVQKDYFMNLVLGMFRKNQNKITFCDDIVYNGNAYSSSRKMVEDAVKTLKEKGLISPEYEVFVGITTIVEDHFLSSKIFADYITDENFGQKGGSKSKDWLARKYLRFIGTQTAKDYCSLSKIRTEIPLSSGVYKVM
jgi:hypothetical protein